MLKKFAILYFVLLFTFTGCAVGNYGPTMWTKYTYTPTATIVEVNVLGLHARANSFDSGATLGYRDVIYIFPCKNEKVGEEVKLFRVEWPGMNQEKPGEEKKFNWLNGKPSLVRINTAYGLELQLTPEINRLTAGYLNQVITIGSGENESKVVMFSFKKDDLSKTIISILTKEGVANASPC